MHNSGFTFSIGAYGLLFIAIPIGAMLLYAGPTALRSKKKMEILISHMI